MERCGKINSWNSVAESWTGIGVVAGLLAGVGMLEWPYLKMAQPVSYRSYLQILECVRKIGKTCNQFNAIVISLTSEDRRARPHIRSWERGHPPYGLIYCAAARIGTCAFKKRRTRSIVRCFSSSGSFHGYTVISAFGASEATSIEVCSGCPGTSSGSTSTGVRQCRM